MKRENKNTNHSVNFEFSKCSLGSFFMILSEIKAYFYLLQILKNDEYDDIKQN